MSYEVGDIVQLKSGGPTMTISRDEVFRGFTGYAHLRECTWFDESGNLHKETFPIDSLVEASKTMTAIEQTLIAAAYRAAAEVLINAGMADGHYEVNAIKKLTPSDAEAKLRELMMEAALSVASSVYTDAEVKQIVDEILK